MEDLLFTLYAEHSSVPDFFIQATMNDPGLDEPIGKDAKAVDVEDQKQKQDEEDEREEDEQEFLAPTFVPNPEYHSFLLFIIYTA